MGLLAPGCRFVCVAQPGRAIVTDEIVTGIIMGAAAADQTLAVTGESGTAVCEIGVARGPPVDGIADVRMVSPCVAACCDFQVDSTPHEALIPLSHGDDEQDFHDSSSPVFASPTALW